MSASHGRRLGSLELPSGQGSGKATGKASGGEGDDFNATVRAANRRREEERAPAIALVEFAQALAGTVLQAPAEELGARDSARVVPRFSGASFDVENAALECRAPSPPRRPDQHTEVTWEEAMRAEWVGLPELKSDPPPRPEPGFEPWDPIIPSYAEEVEEE